MNLPIETVVELLMTGSWNDVTYWAVMIPRPKTGLSPLRITADTESDLRTKVREYLLTLVPKPVLLSECEEGKPCVRINRFGEWSVVVREGMSAYSMHNRPALRQLIDKDANRVKVIQPVEVQ